MKRFLKSRLVLTLAAVLMLAAAIAIPLSGSITRSHAASSIPWNTGDVFAGVSNGQYNVYDNTGASKDSINDGQGGFTTGCAFNGGLDKLYTTNFSNTKVEVYDNAIPHTLSQTVDTAANGGSSSESVVFASNGDFYVGNAGANQILRYNAAGTFQQAYTAATEDRGTDWLDLASDQKTIFYTSEGGLIKRFDVSGAGAQLVDFASIGGTSYALRLLPPGDGTGGLLVANSTDIKRLDGAGNVVQTYDAPGEDSWFSLNLDPNGTSFWAGDFGTNNFYRFNITTGAIEVGPIASGGTLFGLCVKGELTAAIPEISLSPQTATNDAVKGNTHTVTATVKQNGQPVVSTKVTFSVVSGPNTGATGTCSVNVSCATDANGQVAFTYASNGTVGTDTIKACFTDNTGTQHCATATKDWVAPKSLPGGMTGGGTIGNKLATHGFELQCDTTKSPNSLEVNWGKNNKFHLDTLTSALCSDDPKITPNPPSAGFDTYKGTGAGTYNGVAGATAEWTFTDAGEPGTNDSATITIKDVHGNIVLNVSGKLSKGNQQAHNP